MPGHGARGLSRTLTYSELASLPAEIHALGAALLRIRDLAAPTLGRGDHMPLGRARTHHGEDEPPVPDPTGEHVTSNHWQRVYERERRRIRRHADEINDTIDQRDSSERGKQQCTGEKCRRWIRRNARFCEHCGASQTCTDQQAS